MIRALCVFFVMIAVACASPPRSAIVILVRHGEKAVAATNDPSLSDAGRARAAALIEALRDAGVTRVITDQSHRTIETAAPLIQRQGVKSIVIQTDWGHVDPSVHAIADSVRRPGGVTLVIGHRNTVPAIISALGGPTIPEIGADDYGDLYIMILGAPSVAPALLHATFGAAAGHPM